MDFFLLEQDLRIPDTAAIGSIPDSIEPLDWIRGRTMNDPGPLKLTLAAASGDFRGDIIGSLLTLFSDELKKTLTDFGVTNIDYFPVDLQDPNSCEVEDGYWLVNVKDVLECVDMSRSTVQPRPSGSRGRLQSFYIDTDRAANKSIFRLAEQPTLIVINKDLRQFLLKSSLVGLRLRHTKVYDGF